MSHTEISSNLDALTRGWGERCAVSLFLERCQVNTPERLVSSVWQHLVSYRQRVGKVIDFGAGDGRFARYGAYDTYVGYEIDASRCSPVAENATVLNACAFSSNVYDADLCIGNPPFVRNQDLPSGWQTSAAKLLKTRTGVQLSGLANAWQYFFLLGLASVKTDGLCALVVPYEWVSRPSARVLRDYIRNNGWNVDVYRLVDETFRSVMTTASITVVDKSVQEGRWRYFEETAQGRYKPLASASGSAAGVLQYAIGKASKWAKPFVRRGTSPGTQKVLVLTEGQRVSNGLQIRHDVVPCVTSLKPLPAGLLELDEAAFDKYYRCQGEKCWLIRTDKDLSPRLAAYLDAVPAEAYQTKTCLARQVWWRFKFPEVPDVLVAQTFKRRFPKAVRNSTGARAVGGVSGVYRATDEQAADLIAGFGEMDISDRVVSYAKGLRKIEINQLNWVLRDRFGSGSGP